ncbi:MAG: hypothetical protein DWP98_09260 [Bacteroidetes bacterium]|nr:MAG: hypothetical protein DWP98_09260 [Bacteroidota bacterium]MCB0803963.1 hypothetical protein [Flavobacteriales bacterium]
MNATVRTIVDQNGKDSGSIIHADISRPTTALQKAQIEVDLIDYAFSTLYPREGLSIYSNIHSDTPSITVIRDINKLSQRTVVI